MEAYRVKYLLELRAIFDEGEEFTENFDNLCQDPTKKETYLGKLPLNP